MSHVQNELANVQGESLKAGLQAVFPVTKFWTANPFVRKKTMFIILTPSQIATLYLILLNAGDDPRLTKRQQTKADNLFLRIFREG